MNVIPIDQEKSEYIGRTDVPEKFVLEGKPSYETWLSRASRRGQAAYGTVDG